MVRFEFTRFRPILISSMGRKIFLCLQPWVEFWVRLLFRPRLQLGSLSLICSFLALMSYTLGSEVGVSAFRAILWTYQVNL